MTPSPACISLIQSFEQCRLTAYMPTANDRPTIGWGSTGPDITLGLIWTQQQCDDRFASDLADFASQVSDQVTSVTTQNQFDAMVSLAYNIGLDGFEGSTVLREHNMGNYASAAAAFALWNKQDGVVLNGLTRRRAAEAALYQGT